MGWDPSHGEELKEAELAVPSGTPIPAGGHNQPQSGLQSPICDALKTGSMVLKCRDPREWPESVFGHVLSLHEAPMPLAMTSWPMEPQVPSATT